MQTRKFAYYKLTKIKRHQSPFMSGLPTGILLTVVKLLSKLNGQGHYQATSVLVLLGFSSSQIPYYIGADRPHGERPNAAFILLNLTRK